MCLVYIKVFYGFILFFSLQESIQHRYSRKYSGLIQSDKPEIPKNVRFTLLAMDEDATPLSSPYSRHELKELTS